jgi:hypothetical protein
MCTIPKSEFFASCFHAFESALAINPSKVGCSGFRLTRPRFPPAVVHDICREASHIFRRADVVLELHSPIVIVGDIHGQVLDLIRIFQQIGNPLQRNISCSVTLSGKAPLHPFLRASGFSRLMRGHECIDSGKSRRRVLD